MVEAISQVNIEKRRSLIQLDATDGDITYTVGSAATAEPFVVTTFFRTDASGNAITITDGGDLSVSLADQYDSAEVHSNGVTYQHRITSASGGGGGTISGPGSSTNGGFVLWNGTGGTTIKDSTTVPSTFGLSLVDDADASTAQATLGLGTAAVADSTDFLGVADTAADSTKLAGTTPSAYGLTIIDDADAPAARSTLGLGSAATHDASDFTGGIASPGSTTVGNVVLWDDTTGTTVADGGAIIDSTITSPVADDFLVYSGSEFVNQAPATARTSMGLGAMAQAGNLTGDVTATGASGNIATTIAAGAVTLAKMANMATASMLGRATAGSGAPEVLSASSARTNMGLGTMSVVDNLTGDVTATAGTPGNLSTTIATKAVTLAKMNDMATASMLGRATAGTGAPEVLSAASSRTVMAVDFKAGLIIPSPTNAEKIPIFRTHVACTITRISVVMIGSSPSVTWKVAKGSDISASGTAVVTAGTTTTSTTTGADVTSFDSAGVSADDWVWLTTSAQSGTVTWMAVTVYYTKD